MCGRISYRVIYIYVNCMYESVKCVYESDGGEWNVCVYESDMGV